MMLCYALEFLGNRGIGQQTFVISAGLVQITTIFFNRCKAKKRSGLGNFLRIVIAQCLLISIFGLLPSDQAVEFRRG